VLLPISIAISLQFQGNFFIIRIINRLDWPAVSRSNRVLKNKHQAVSQGVRRFGTRSIFIDM
jgi:hypothetical protein